MIPPGVIRRVSESTPLEDELAYVWRKAMRGAGLNANELAQKCSVSPGELDKMMRESRPESLVRKAAEVLSLSADALLGLSRYRPVVPILHGISRLDMPFEEDSVNAWLVRDEDHALLFDTGYLADSATRLLAMIGVAEVELFLTHDHRDHVGGITMLAPLLRKIHEIPQGQSLSFGSLRVKCIDLAGHCMPTSGYVISGLSRPVCVTGDALFAGSIGGCADAFAYQMALRNIRQHILTLPDDTILLPGHGPATTVGQERENNPFLA
jgi:glyoxylase-like metal-dependent hydrolase (beta-lactamase superfamily II)